MTAPAPQALAFPDRKEDKRFPVLGPDGRLVAYVSARWTGQGFSAVDAAEQPLCAGSVGLGGLARTWKVTGPDGAALLELKPGWTSRKGTITLARGDTFELAGSAWRRDFSVTRPGDGTVLTAVPQGSAWSFHPYHYAVQQLEPVFGLAELVAVVQTWRMVQKASDAAGGAVAAAT